MQKKKYLANIIFSFSALLTAKGVIAHETIIDSPVAVVSSLYKNFAWEAIISRPDESAKLFGENLESQPKNILNKYFDKDMTMLFLNNQDCERKNVGEECNLDFDPIFDSQDSSADDLTIRSIDSSRVEVIFTYSCSGPKIKMEYITKLTSQGWRIVDIIYNDKNNKSLKKILSGRL